MDFVVGCLEKMALAYIWVFHWHHFCVRVAEEVGTVEELWTLLYSLTY